jgi:hypothetical protein
MYLYAPLSVAIPAAAQLASTGATFNINGTYYFVSPYASGQAHDGSLGIQGLQQRFGFAPVTVVSDQASADSFGPLFAS